MGLLSLSMLILVSLPCAICKAPTTCTTTPLRSLADPGGVFDIPKVKCPPDRGSSDCVTGNPAPISTFSPNNNYFNAKHIPHSHSTHHLSTAAPRPIPQRSRSDLATPPLTPDDGSDSSIDSLPPSSPAFRHDKKDALDFLMTVFPRHGLGALTYAKSVSISSPLLGADFDGVVLDMPGKTKTLYVDGKSAESVSLRESIVALLELADESLHCAALVIVLERSSPKLAEILHSLMYVGGTVVTKPPFPVDPGFVLVGLEI